MKGDLRRCNSLFVLQIKRALNERPYICDWGVLVGAIIDRPYGLRQMR